MYNWNIFIAIINLRCDKTKTVRRDYKADCVNTILYPASILKDS